MQRHEALLQQLAQEPLALVEQVLDLEVRLRETEAKLVEAQALIAELRRQLFGPKAEKLSPDQQAHLDALASDLGEEAQKPPPLSQEVLEEERRDQRRRRAERRPPRHPLPAVLETETVTLEPASTLCPHCGVPQQKIGEEVSEEIDLIPSRRAG
jgi:transposase